MTDASVSGLTDYIADNNITETKGRSSEKYNAIKVSFASRGDLQQEPPLLVGEIGAHGVVEEAVAAEGVVEEEGEAPWSTFLSRLDGGIRQSLGPRPSCS